MKATQNISFSELIELRGSALYHELKFWNRKQLISFLSWNDKNGVYTDKQSKAEGFDPLTLPEAFDLVIKQIEEA